MKAGQWLGVLVSVIGREVWVRYGEDRAPAASVSRSGRYGALWHWRVGRGVAHRFGHVKTRDEAKAAADEALKAQGWTLSGEEWVAS